MSKRPAMLSMLFGGENSFAYPHFRDHSRCWGQSQEYQRRLGLRPSAIYPARCTYCICHMSPPFAHRLWRTDSRIMQGLMFSFGVQGRAN